MKQFLSNRVWREILDLLAQTEVLTRLSVRPPRRFVEQISTVNFLEFLETTFLAITAIFDICYSPSVSGNFVERLETNRDTLISFLAWARYPLGPAVHYMLSHFIHDVRIMAPISPYQWLCECNEAFHAYLKKMATLTLYGRKVTRRDKYNTPQLIIRHATTMHLCRYRNKQLL